MYLGRATVVRIDSYIQCKETSIKHSEHNEAWKVLDLMYYEQNVCPSENSTDVFTGTLNEGSR